MNLIASTKHHPLLLTLAPSVSKGVAQDCFIRQPLEEQQWARMTIHSHHPYTSRKEHGERQSCGHDTSAKWKEIRPCLQERPMDLIPGKAQQNHNIHERTRRRHP